MSYKKTLYTAKEVDKAGNALYTPEENATWHQLILRQKKIVAHRACAEYLKGIQLLNLSEDRIPQCHEISAVLRDITGWSLEPVPALIPFEHFFHLLANKQFPAATFIRTQADLDYLEEPDIFHEVFGHCPLLTNPAYAEFAYTYGKLGLNANPLERKMLARLYWFTIEFGLIKQNDHIYAYGGGILSSANETIYCIESPIPERKPFDPLEAFYTKIYNNTIYYNI